MRVAARFAPLASALALAGCQDHTGGLALTLPDARWVAIVALAGPPGGPTFAGATPLRPAGLGAEFPASLGDETTRKIAIGWRGDLIAPLEPPEDVGEQPLERSMGGCAAALPRPSVAREIRPDGSAGSDVDPASIPLLTADWMAERCPIDLDPSAILFDVRCGFQGGCRFESRATADRCEVVLEATSEECEPRSLRLGFDRLGSACFSDAGSLRCDPPTGRLPGEVDLLCRLGADRCDLSLYAGASTSAFAIEVHPLLGDRLMRPEGIDGDIDLRRSHLDFGYLWGLAVTRDRVFVSTPDSDPPWHIDRCPAGTDETYPASRVLILDRVTLQPKLTATAPPCLRELWPDPSSDGFLGIAQASLDELTLIKFDRDAIATTSTVWRLPADVSRDFVNQGSYGLVRDLAIDGRGRGVFTLGLVTDRARARSPTETEYLVPFDPSTLEIGAPLAFPMAELRALSPTADGFYVTDEEQPFLYGLGGASALTISQGPLPIAPGSYTFVRVHAGPADARLVLGRIRHRRGIDFLSPSTAVPLLPTAGSFEVAAAPTSGGPWHDGAILVALTDDIAQASWVARVDPIIGKVLPGAARVARAPLTELRKDPTSDALFGLVSWTGELVRISPR